MDAYLAIVSLRAVHEYADRPIPDSALRRILEAGRATGSAQNRQPWRFYVVRSRELLDILAGVVYEPANLQGCQAAIALTTTSKSTFDAGRCAQNLALAAWADGIASSPNGVKDREAAHQVLVVREDETIATILSFGYPLRPRQPAADDVEGVLQRIKRKPLEELTTWVD
jgi:nitroreductase